MSWVSAIIQHFALENQKGHQKVFAIHLEMNVLGKMALQSQAHFEGRQSTARNMPQYFP
jgi:hypothetical protein